MTSICILLILTCIWFISKNYFNKRRYRQPGILATLITLLTIAIIPIIILFIGLLIPFIGIVLIILFIICFIIGAIDGCLVIIKELQHNKRKF